jgi:hypothetical protein
MGVLCQLKQQESNMSKQYEDPNRTGSPDDCFNKFIGHLTGRDPDDLDFYEQRPIDPEPSQYEKEQEAIRMAEEKKDVDYFMRRQINQFARSSEQRDALLKQHGLEVE